MSISYWLAMINESHHIQGIELLDFCLLIIKNHTRSTP